MTAVGREGVSQQVTRRLWANKIAERFAAGSPGFSAPKKFVKFLTILNPLVELPSYAKRTLKKRDLFNNRMKRKVR